MDEGDPVDKNKITMNTLASITVKMTPNLQGKKKNPKKNQAGPGEGG